MQQNSLFGMGPGSSFRALFSPFRSPSRIAHLETKSRSPTNPKSPAAVEGEEGADMAVEATRGDEILPATYRHYALQHRSSRAELFDQRQSSRSIASGDLLPNGEAAQEATDPGDSHRLQRASGWGLVGWDSGDMWVGHVPSLWCKRRSSSFTKDVDTGKKSTPACPGHKRQEGQEEGLERRVLRRPPSTRC